MIPPYNLNGVLPPFTGQNPGMEMALSSPYQCSPAEIVERFSSTQHRKNLLLGFFRFRAELRANGIGRGFQWINGSFTENVEAVGRNPNDIDVVTLAFRPDVYAEDQLAWSQFVADQANGGIFDRNRNRQEFTCDAFFLDLHSPPENVARQAAYWNGLFSHRRDTFQWKGMLALPLHIDDAAAVTALEAEVGHE